MVNARFIHYRTGIEKIDEQHFVIFSALEDIDFLMSIEDYNDISSLLLAVLNSFKEDTIIENQEMLTINFPYRVAHIESHNKLIRAFEELYTQVSAGVISLKHYRTRIRDQAELIYQHIDYNDIAYADWLQKNSTIA